MFISRKKKHSKQSGQATIFMALFISTMILLFAFTTNIGMLVHAKINLQNAADAAAYAGAAVQARQLTNVAYLNWEMRRAIKEFLFLYMVRGNLAQACFPKDGSGSPREPGCPPLIPSNRYGFEFADPKEFSFGTFEPPGPYLPSVCIIFDPINNYCQKGGVPGIPEFKGGGAFGVADPIVNTVKQATAIIIDKKVGDCLSRTSVNQKFITAWLFNLFAEKNTIQASNKDADDPFDVAGIDGLGILPRLAMLRARIDNIEESLNLNLSNEGFSSASVDDSTLAEIQSQAQSTSLAYYERPIQAYLSAKNNLPSVGDNGIFSEVTLNELIPNVAGSALINPKLSNPPVLAKFHDITSTISLANSAFRTLDGEGIDRGNCQQYREVRDIPAFPFGITKDPSIITYYAVHLQAKARLLFSPFGDRGVVTLSAYSAAKPFGSRIGKDLSINPDAMMLARVKTNRDDPVLSNLSKRTINLLVADNDSNSETGGFARNDHLGYLYNIISRTGRRDFAYRAAGAYAPWEIGFYTPPANYKQPADIDVFPDNPSFTINGRFQLDAPLMPIKNQGIGLSFLRSRIEEYLTGEGIVDGLDNLEFQALIQGQLSDSAFAQLDNFLNTNNLYNSHLIPDPMLNDLPQVLSLIASDNGSRFTVAAMQEGQRRQLTSWNNYKTAGDVEEGPAHSELSSDMGRSGYSVRFVSFASLMAGGQSTNDPEVTNSSFSNPFLRLDAGAAGARIQDDLSKIKH